MRTATKPYILSPLQGLLLQEAQDVIPDCQKHFSAAYQDLKTIVEEDVSAESFCCHCDATFHSTYMRCLEQEGYPRQKLVLSKSRLKFGNVYERVTL